MRTSRKSFGSIHRIRRRLSIDTRSTKTRSIHHFNGQTFNSDRTSLSLPCWSVTLLCLSPSLISLSLSLPVAQAPDMFDKTHIWSALKQVESILLGKYGMKTLDPRSVSFFSLRSIQTFVCSDYNYVPNYVNDDDSHDFQRAGGFNYHNGPEWLWLTGYYIRAKFYWSKQQDDPSISKQTVKHLRELLSKHMQLIFSSEWKGLPELTDANGQPCPYSCSVQAWSAATLLEAFYDLTRA